MKTNLSLFFQMTGGKERARKKKERRIFLKWALRRMLFGQQKHPAYNFPQISHIGTDIPTKNNWLNYGSRLSIHIYLCIYITSALYLLLIRSGCICMYVCGIGIGRKNKRREIAEAAQVPFFSVSLSFAKLLNILVSSFSSSSSSSSSSSFFFAYEIAHGLLDSDIEEIVWSVADLNIFSRAVASGIQ